MTKTETLERIRKARYELEPLVGGDKKLGRRFNNVLNELARIQAMVESK